MEDKYIPVDRPQLTLEQINAFSNFQPTYTNNLAKQVQSQFEENVSAVQRAREEKEAEELRRHNELVQAVQDLNQTMKETVLEALRMGASVNIDGNTGNINISMNSTNVEQNANQESGFDFEAVQGMISGIEKYFNIPTLVEELGDKADLITATVTEINEGLKRKDASFIKKSLNTLKELATGISGSLIATGIVEGIKKIGMIL